MPKLNVTTEEIEQRFWRWKWLYYQNITGCRLRMRIQGGFVTYNAELDIYGIHDPTDNLSLEVKPFVVEGLLDDYWHYDNTTLIVYPKRMHIDEVYMLSDNDDEGNLFQRGGGL